MALDTSNWTRDDLIREARLQTDAIQRLNVWLRIGYSLVAAGFIVGYWGFYGGGGTGFGVLGVALLVVGALVSVVLKGGTTKGGARAARRTRKARRTTRARSPRRGPGSACALPGPTEESLRKGM